MKKIGLICLAVVLALAGLGIGFAHWSDQLYVEGTVKGGQLMVGFTEVICTEMYGDPPVEGEYLDKDVGKCEVAYEVERTCTHTGKTGYEGILVTITDAYPCYHVHIVFAIENLGTIPVIFEGVTITDPDGVLVYDEALAALVDPADPTVPIINFDFVNLIGVQLEPQPTEPYDTKAEVDVHFKQDAKECHTYKFKVDIDAIQWNKYVP